MASTERDTSAGCLPPAQEKREQAAVALRPTVGQVKKKRPWWRKPLLRAATVVAPPLLSGLLRVMEWTLRITVVNGDGLYGRWTRGERTIVAFWHDRLLMMPIAARRHPLCIMNSQHRDGEIASRAIARWGIRSVRGSATRGAVPGFLRLVRAYRSGSDLAVVPDGPRGPGHRAKPGVIQLAKMTGAPIIPVSYAADRVKRLRSWDRLMIPLPFARVTLAIGEAVRVPRDADERTMEDHRQLLEERLNELGRRAELQLGI
jgi:lysophospholipid acyltransferase (LPLAT)-like uncharacterized protein